jgi:hypothetical protein
MLKETMRSVRPYRLKRRSAEGRVRMSGQAEIAPDVEFAAI